MTDTLSDLLTQIRNANQAYLAEIKVPYSQMKWAVLNLLKKEGFLAGAEVFVQKGKSYKEIIVKLKFLQHR